MSTETQKGCDFTIGDLAKLKSGGPLMTINKVSGGGAMLECIWFTDTGKEGTPLYSNMNQGIFRKEALARYSVS